MCLATFGVSRIMSEITRNLRRRAPRFQIKNSDVLNVTVSKGEQASEPIDAEIVNVSVGGAKFKSKQPVAVHEYLFVKIEVEDLSQALYASGKVRWTVPLDDDEWWIGCAFVPEIPHETLSDFARRGILERRDHPWRCASLQVNVEWQSEKEPTQVTVVDYSQGGLCFVSAQHSAPGERVMLQVQLEDGRQVKVRAVIRWRAKSSDGYLIGCEFVEPRDYLEISNLLESSRDFEAEEEEALALKKAAEHIFGDQPVPDRPEWSIQSMAKSVKQSASWLLFSLTMLGVLGGIAWQQMSVSEAPRLLDATTILTGATLSEQEYRQHLATDDHRVIPMTSEQGSTTEYNAEIDRSVDSSSAPPASPRLSKVSSAAFPAVRQAVNAQLNGDHAEAIRQYRQAAALDHTSPLIWYLLAATQYEAGQQAEAEVNLGFAIECEMERPLDDLSKYTRRFSDGTRSWISQQREAHRESH